MQFYEHCYETNYDIYGIIIWNMMYPHCDHEYEYLKPKAHLLQTGKADTDTAITLIDTKHLHLWDMKV